MSDHIKKGVLGVLVLVWALLILVRVMNSPDPQRVPLTFKTGSAVRIGSGSLLGLQPLPPPGEAEPFKRPKNIFAPLEVPPQSAHSARVAKRSHAGPPDALHKPPSDTPLQVPVPSSPRSEEVASKRAREEAQQRMAQYRYLGYLTRTGESQAFLGKGTEIYIVKRGDLLEGGLQVTRIESAAVRLRDPGTNQEKTLTLVSDGSGLL